MEKFEVCHAVGYLQWVLNMSIYEINRVIAIDLIVAFFPLQVTKASFTDDGFFKTGDAVTVDEDGYYIILGSKNLSCGPFFFKYTCLFIPM